MQALWILKKSVYKSAIYYAASQVLKLFLSHRIILRAFFFLSYLCPVAKMSKMLQLPFPTEILLQYCYQYYIWFSLLPPKLGSCVRDRLCKMRKWRKIASKRVRFHLHAQSCTSKCKISTVFLRNTAFLF